MKHHSIQKYLCVLIAAMIVSACNVAAETAPPAQTPITSAEIEDVIAQYRQEIPQLMEEQNVPGLAIAVVDDQKILWAEGFGFTDSDGRTAVTPDTIFSVQSMSKLFTATGVMRAVQDGVLDLDTPITTYLPAFTVHSIFEERPERKITLRHLLSHTAGFTHEAPIGNNWDADATSFEAHIRSISDTWLRFPVGTGYAYSNLGIDLAGYILQTASGQTFADYERDHLFRPLGMTNSSFDMAVIAADASRAIGHVEMVPAVPVGVPMVAAGGMYSSANDLARYLQFQLNQGVVDGQHVLSPALLDEMLTVQFTAYGRREGYGLGVARTGWFRGRNADLFSHGGGGFGFLADLWWLPELKVGIAVLTNSSEHNLQGSLALQILYDVTHQPGPYYDRLMAMPAKSPVTEGNGGWRPPARLEAEIAARAVSSDPAGWQQYLGDYQVANWNVINPFSAPSRVYEQDGALYFDGRDVEDAAELRLYEMAPGLFFTETGQALDFRTTPPTYRNLKLTRVGAGPSPLALGVLVACGLVLLSVVVTPFVHPIVRKVWRRGVAVDSPAPQRAVIITASGLTIAGSLFGLACIGLVALFPRLIYSGFLGWLTWPVGIKLLFHAPLGLAVCAVALVVIVIRAWRQGWAGQRWQDTAWVVAALAETALLASWRLIGLG